MLYRDKTGTTPIGAHRHVLWPGGEEAKRAHSRQSPVKPARQQGSQIHWMQRTHLNRSQPLSLEEQQWLLGSPAQFRDSCSQHWAGDAAPPCCLAHSPTPPRSPGPLGVSWAGRGREIMEVARAAGQGPGGPTSEGPAGAAGKSSDLALGGRVQNNQPHHSVRTRPGARRPFLARALPNWLQKVTAISGSAWQQDAAPRRPQRASAREAAEAQ